jgi:hypothetical protein
MSIEQHDFEWWDDGTANCSCGWGGRREFDTRIEAEEAWSNHCERVFLEASEQLEQGLAREMLDQFPKDAPPIYAAPDMSKAAGAIAAITFLPKDQVHLAA